MCWVEFIEYKSQESKARETIINVDVQKGERGKECRFMTFIVSNLQVLKEGLQRKSEGVYLAVHV